MRTEPRVAELGARLRELTKTIRLVRQHRGGTHPGVPAALLATLTYIDRISECHAKELAAGAGLDPSTVSRAVATLVSQGMVERRADPHDRRASILAVTGAGRSALADAHGWYESVLRDALTGWSDADVATLTHLIGRFATDLDHALRRAPAPEREDTPLENAR